jgi:thiamine biosynthesis protein ThiS
MLTQPIGITVNGQPLTIPPRTTVADLLVLLKIKSPAIAVELNLEIQPSHRFSELILHSADSLEIVTLAGGG